MTPQPLYIASCSFGKDSVATIPYLAHIRKHYPDLWAELCKFNEIPNKVSEKFNKRYTFNELEAH